MKVGKKGYLGMFSQTGKFWEYDPITQTITQIWWLLKFHKRYDPGYSGTVPLSGRKFKGDLAILHIFGVPNTL